MTSLTLDIDQNPRRLGFELYQGIANLAPNGPEDGGLCVLKGSHKLHEEHFASIGGFRPECDAGPEQNSYKYHNLDDFAWYKERCEAVKVCAPEGGLICKCVGERVRMDSHSSGRGHLNLCRVSNR